MRKAKVCCPKNILQHKTFVTVAHVSQDWKVDEYGDFIECVNDSIETIVAPDTGNIWLCAKCGAEASVIK